jgi:hypothetical protein
MVLIRQGQGAIQTFNRVDPDKMINIRFAGWRISGGLKVRKRSGSRKVGKSVPIAIRRKVRKSKALKKGGVMP